MSGYDGPSLSYFLSEKRSILIVTWIGPWIRCNSGVFAECAEAVSKSEAKWVIFNCRDVPSQMDKALEPSLARLQKMLRDRKAQVRISGLHPELRKSLLESGIVRSSELHDNLTAAVNEVFLQLRKTA